MCSMVGARWMVFSVWLVLASLAGIGLASAGTEDQTDQITAPAVSSQRVMVMDAATGAILYARNADDVAAIASTGKIFVGLVASERKLALTEATKMTKVDRDFARGGARTRLSVNHSFRNRDLLRAMLIASDNRAPTALGRAVGLSPKQLIAAMNEVARKLGLKDTRFTDPSGLRGNVSTARDMAIAFRAALADPLLAEVLGTREVHVRATHKRAKRIYYRNTNQVLHNDKYQVLGGKTGFTRKAGYCLLVAANVAGRDVVMVFLGGKGKNTRFRDFYRAVEWISAGHAPDIATAPRAIDETHGTRDERGDEKSQDSDD